MKKGDLLFVIEQTMYQAKVKEAQAELDSAKAQLLNAEAEFTRQETLLRQNVTAQNTYDQAKAKRDSARANVENQEGNLVIAQTNLGYTTRGGAVRRRRHQASDLGRRAGRQRRRDQARHHRPAQPDLRRIQHERAGRPQHPRQAQATRLTVEELSKIPLDIGLMDEEGFPHQGFLNYVSPELDPMTGTILVRGLFNNPNRDLLPGFFARIRVPTALGATADFIIPDRVIAEDQAGKYVLVVNKDNVVEQTPHHDRPAAGRWPAGDLDRPQGRRSRRADDQWQGGPGRQGRAQGNHHRHAAGERDTGAAAGAPPAAAPPAAAPPAAPTK